MIALASAVLAGCGGELSGDRSPPAGSVAVVPPAPRDAAIGLDAGDASVAMPEIAIVAPTEGASFVRSTVVSGEWAARVSITVEASGVHSVDVLADGMIELGTLPPMGGSLSGDFFADGAHTITAIGRDASGVELVRDELTITITPPADTGCHAMLDALGLDWEARSGVRGVSDPVLVQPTIRGVRFRYVSNAEPTAMIMACELAPHLVQLAELVREYGIDEVIHIGIYNYRCIGGGDPDVDGCTPSQHATATAIDLHAFGLEGSDVEYSTEDDFVITMRADSCPMRSSSEPDRVLKDIACRLVDEGVFNIVLTPNYNDAHRNHYHVDLTAGSRYLGVSASGVDPIVSGLGD